MTSALYFRPAARQWRTAPTGESSIEFHQGMPGYAPTPLIELPELARDLGVGRLFVKDESARLGLPAFKILGASYAIAKTLSRRLRSRSTLPLSELRRRLQPGSLRLIAATDGNHGRAVAHVAALLDQDSTIYVPADVSAAAKQAIIAEGAHLVEMSLPYDDVVAHAAAQTDQHTLIIQDTSWPGYTQIPAWIVAGYTTLVQEVDGELQARGIRPDLVVVPAGVGSLAHAVVAHYRSGEHAPSVLVVEPQNAPSITSALRAGEPLRVSTRETVMTGLNCGTVSAAAWPVLQDGVDRAVTVSDDEALAATATLAQLGMDCGPCGAATLAGVRALQGTTGDPADPAGQAAGQAGSEARRAAVGEAAIEADAVVVLLSTEGRAANPKGTANP